jgi:hypothetical protein
MYESMQRIKYCALGNKTRQIKQCKNLHTKSKMQPTLPHAAAEVAIAIHWSKLTS